VSYNNLLFRIFLGQHVKYCQAWLSRPRWFGHMTSTIPTLNLEASLIWIYLPLNGLLNITSEGKMVYSVSNKHISLSQRITGHDIKHHLYSISELSACNHSEWHPFVYIDA